MKAAILIALCLTYSAWAVITTAHASATKVEPVPEVTRPPVPDCEGLYDVGEHEAWAACMGVGYK